jgi:hypothetical protein
VHGVCLAVVLSMRFCSLTSNYWTKVKLPLSTKEHKLQRRRTLPYLGFEPEAFWFQKSALLPTELLRLLANDTGRLFFSSLSLVHVDRQAILRNKFFKKYLYYMKFFVFLAFLRNKELKISLIVCCQILVSHTWNYDMFDYMGGCYVNVNYPNCVHSYKYFIGY